MSDGDTRKVDERALRDPNSQWAPFAKFKSFKRADQMWAIGGLIFLIIIINIVFATG